LRTQRGDRVIRGSAKSVPAHRLAIGVLDVVAAGVAGHVEPMVVVVELQLGNPPPWPSGRATLACLGLLKEPPAVSTS
jgi:hypothetical protein